MKNPIMNMDFPDPDVIRVDDTYYMVSTTMYFMPGCAILRSYDLMNWELIGHVYDKLEDVPEHNLYKDTNIYGQGMWAPCIRYNKGKFYVCFSSNDMHTTYLFTADSVEGPWTKGTIAGFYYDSSLLFDDDGKVYIVHGNKTIRITELEDDLSGPKDGGFDEIVIEDKDHPGLGYEGSHFYKINGRYYVFFIHSLREKWFRTEACFTAKTLDGEWEGGDVLVDDMGYRGMGVAQGGIVDTPDGDWYAVLFQDRGAVGRVPVVVPFEWKDGMPAMGDRGYVPKEINIKSTRPDHKYEPLYASDDFSGKLKNVWEWNHNPQSELWSLDERKGALRLTSGKFCKELTESYNTLTQRTKEPVSSGIVTVDASGINAGDYAGICALQGQYAAVAITKKRDIYQLVMFGNGLEIFEKVNIDSPVVRLKCTFDSSGENDTSSFYYQKGDEWVKIGITKKMVFRLDHFTGCRFGLFNFSTEETGGYA